MISMLRMLLVIPLVLLFDQPRTNQLLIAGLGLFAYLTDLADGWVARKFEGESAFGRIIDPLADKVFITAVVLLMIGTHMIPLWFAVVVIARDIIIFAGGMYLRRRSGVLVQSNMLGKATVVSIGVVLVAALFGEGGTNVTLMLLMFVSLGLITASLYVYAERFFKLLPKGGTKK
jgi:cardiolipin synthase (CMP-forming)